MSVGWGTCVRNRDSTNHLQRFLFLLAMLFEENVRTERRVAIYHSFTGGPAPGGHKDDGLAPCRALCPQGLSVMGARGAGDTGPDSSPAEEPSREPHVQL